MPQHNLGANPNGVRAAHRGRHRHRLVIVTASYRSPSWSHRENSGASGAATKVVQAALVVPQGWEEEEEADRPGV
jgi:hypothetical protein